MEFERVRARKAAASRRKNAMESLALHKPLRRDTLSADEAADSDADGAPPRVSIFEFQSSKSVYGLPRARRLANRGFTVVPNYIELLGLKLQRVCPIYNPTEMVMIQIDPGLILPNHEPLDRSEEEQLFFDLVFVAATIKLGNFLKGDLSATSFFTVAMFFILLWTSWLHTTLIEARYTIRKCHFFICYSPPPVAKFSPQPPSIPLAEPTMPNYAWRALNRRSQHIFRPGFDAAPSERHSTNIHRISKRCPGHCKLCRRNRAVCFHN